MRTGHEPTLLLGHYECDDEARLTNRTRDSIGTIVFSALSLGKNFAIAVALASVAEAGMAATQCPWIRPPGLSEAQINQVVEGRIQEVSIAAARHFDRMKTFKDLDGTDNAIINWAVAVIRISHTLGFDGAAAFYEAAKAKGASNAFDSVSIEELDAISRKAYLAGKDALPPVVESVAQYEVTNIIVSAPPPRAGWRLVRCDPEGVAFRRTGASDGIEAAAMAGFISLPRYTDERSFVDYTKDTVARSLAASIGSRLVEVQPIKGAPSPCVQMRVGSGSESSPRLFYGRFCYDDADRETGYNALFSISGKMGAEQAEAEADSFFDGVTRRHVR